MSPSARPPWSVLASAGVLAALGLGGIARGDELLGGDFAAKQRLWLTLAGPALLAAAAVPHRVLRPLAWPLFLSAVALLVAVFFFPPRNGSRRWIPVGPILFQPSELAKPAFVLVLAKLLASSAAHRRLPGLVPAFVLCVVPLGLILREPDLGTSLVFLPVLFAVLFAAGARFRYLAGVAALGVCCLPVLWAGMSAEQRSRVTTLFTQRDDGPAPRGDGYHLHRSKEVIALGGVTGAEPWFGLGHVPADFTDGRRVADPAAYHLPAARTDFIFCLVAERWGLAGTLGVLAAYAALLWGGLGVAARTADPFARLVAVGVTALLGTQVLINTGMTVGLMPITGLTLPLMSYGGSSLLFTAASVGLLVGIGLRPGVEIERDPLRFGVEERVGVRWSTDGRAWGRG